jgi:hypothetical protein
MGLNFSPKSVAAALGGDVSGNKVLAPGPGHSPKDRSLSVLLDPHAPESFVVHSFAGDDPIKCRDYVRQRLNMSPWQPSKPRTRVEEKTQSTPAAYIYQQADGSPYLRVNRTATKGFWQEHWTGSAWEKGAPEGPKIPYRLPELLRAEHDSVFIVEGEKDADTLAAFGLVATTNSCGAEKWTEEHNEYFVGRDVYILPDNDEAGARHAKQVLEQLTGFARQIRVVNLPGLPEKGDVSKWLEDGGTLDGLLEFIRLAPEPDALTSTDWSKPVELPTGLRPVDPFDFDFLPAVIAPWVRDISDRMQCPPDFVAASAMTALGSAIGRKIGIRPQRKTNWIEVPNLWACIVGRPGTMKSPAMEEALKPLKRLEVDARKAHELAMKEYAVALEAYEVRKEHAKKKARAVLDKAALDKGIDIAGMLQLEAPEEPKARRFIVNDTTYEALGEILADNPDGVLASRDELISLLKTLDREEYVAARGFFLTAWNGTSGYTFDRIMRGRTHIEAACLGLLGSTQPGRLAEYMRRAVTGGAGDDGLIQRFGLLVWPDQTPAWKEVDQYPDSDARNAAWGVFQHLSELSPMSIGAEMDAYDAIPFLRFDERAQAHFSEWREKLELRLRSGDLHPAMESHLSKYRKLVPALSLINHLADAGRDQVNEEAVLRAISYSKYLESHARRAYAAGSEAETAAAKAILGHIRKGDLTDGFTARDILQRDWSSLTDRDQVHAGLNLLAEYDWITAKPVKTAGRPKTVYLINPSGTLK